ncbi:acetamidase/formamidase family protein [Actinomadura nitritigenes]
MTEITGETDTDVAEETDIDAVTYTVGPDVPMAARVRLGEHFRVRTIDASGGQMHEAVSADAIDQAALFPVTGPIGVEGIRAGDTVGIQLRSVRPASEWGHTWTRPGLGFGSDVEFHVRRLGARRPVIDWLGGGATVDLEARPHVGTLGLLPSDPTEPRDLGFHGGNLDFAHCGPGATVWLRARVDGAGLYLGDVHTAIGDGEVCGTGVEVDGIVDLSVVGGEPWPGRAPVVTMGRRAWVIGVGDTFDEALEVAVQECVTRFADAQGIAHRDAYLAVGLLLEITVCQVVNPRRSVAVSLRSGMDSVLRPAPRPVRPVQGE